MRVLIIGFVLVSLHSSAQKDSVKLAKSSGKFTLLGYGLGEDRLGGAKMGYIDTGVVLNVIDSTKEQYKVRLSSNHTAYVSKTDISIDTSIKHRSYYLASSWSVRGDDNYDYVNISLDEKLPYKSWMEISPAKIMVDIFGVQSNTNWITQLRTVKEVKNVDFNQVEDDVVRVTIELKHQQHWGYTIGYKGRALSIRIRRKPASLSLRKLKIAIDAGHGGSNTGASGLTTKVLEKDYTIRFAKELEKRLRRKGVEVIMTRTSDTNINNADRLLFLQQQMPHMLISIHLNSAANRNVKGVSTYYKHVGFRPLTASILDRMLELGLNEFGNVGHFNFVPNAPTDFHNCLVEVAFLSNEEDEKRIIDPKFQRDVAKKIYKGIKDWLRQVK